MAATLHNKRGRLPKRGAGPCARAMHYGAHAQTPCTRRPQTRAERVRLFRLARLGAWRRRPCEPQARRRQGAPTWTSVLAVEPTYAAKNQPKHGEGADYEQDESVFHELKPRERSDAASDQVQAAAASASVEGSRITTWRELGNPIADCRSISVKVRETVSIVRPR
jgi:hypothetical protein